MDSYRLEDQSTHWHLLLCEAPTPEQAKTFEQEGAVCLRPPCKPLIVDASKVLDFSPPWNRLLLQYARALKALDARMVLVGCSNSLKGQLRTSGLLDSFKLTDTQREALIDLGIIQCTPILKAELINPVLESLIEVIANEVGVQVKPGKIRKKPLRDPWFGDVSIHALVESGPYKGDVILSLSQQLSHEWTRRSRHKLTVVQMLNQATALTREKFDQAGSDFVAEPARVLKKLSQRATRVAVPFDSELGSFELEFLGEHE